MEALQNVLKIMSNEMVEIKNRWLKLLQKYHLGILKEISQLILNHPMLYLMQNLI